MQASPPCTTAACGASGDPPIFDSYSTFARHAARLARGPAAEFGEVAPDVTFGMVIVTGSIRARPDTVERVLSLSLEHVHRSRLEPGCLLHSVHHDAEDPSRFVFLEHWADADTLRAHFEVPASRVFVRELAALGEGAPEIAIYEARPMSV